MLHLFLGAPQSALVAKSVTDSLAIGCDDDWRLLTDSATFTYHNRIDALSVRLNGAMGLVADEKTASDSISIGLTDTVSTLTVSISVADSLTAGLTDTFTGSQALSVL